MPRNDGPCNCRNSGCLLTPSTVRTPPAGTFPLVSANVSSRMVVSDYYEHFLSSPRGLAMGVDALWLELSWNNSKPIPCLLVRPTYQATSHHAGRRCGGLCFKRPCASRRDTPHERARARDEHHSPAMLAAHAFCARDGARDRERAGLRVSGRCRRRVVGRVFGSSTVHRRGKRRLEPW